MRPVTLSDLACAARVLAALPEGQRPAAMAGLIARAEVADRLWHQVGRCHPAYGNGTLMAAAMAHGAGEALAAASPEYLSCLALALDAVLHHGTGKSG